MAAGEIRSHKVSKKTRERKNSKSLDLNTISEYLENGNEEGHDGRATERKSYAIIIDGKTYTCATCKAGHRVGVCKHGRERPMKATHPPGRPPAGAPKKIVCDCPKACSCVKRDCKCARKCNCTQIMYMLVYIPSPDEEEDGDAENGSWKLGEQVTTDLKGNVLTAEEVNERKKKKDAMKSNSSDLQHRGRSTVSERHSSGQNTPKAEIIPESSNCCKHRENVTSQNIAAQASPVTGIVSKSSAEGCNCGHTCTCAFCPQHPNNATSLNVAREQAIHFANHPSMSESSIVAFLPTVPQSISCMGGQPRFAMSRHADRPSFEELQNMFPNPGYVIGYPVWPVRNDRNDFPMSPTNMPNAQPFIHPMHVPQLASPLNQTNDPYQPSLLTPDDTAAFDFSEDDFGIGDAFVASAGTGGWQNQGLPTDSWGIHYSATDTPFDSIIDNSQYIDDPHILHNVPSDSMPNALQHPSHHVQQLPGELLQDRSGIAEHQPLVSTPVFNAVAVASPPRNSCCQPNSSNEAVSEGSIPTVHFSPGQSLHSAPMNVDH